MKVFDGGRRQLVSILVCLSALAGAPAGAEDAPVFSSSSLTPELALALAQATRSACNARDFQVTVAVVDRAGIPQVTLRDQLAGNFTHEVAVLKARTAAGFRRPTQELGAELARRSELRVLHQVDDVLMVGGGVPVEYEGAVVGAVGVSGAPTPEGDHACAVDGIEALADRLLF
ncbi:MAG: GlcG/HbpS family heme-binding protein [Gammaproteobacteria bacterium]